MLIKGYDIALKRLEKNDIEMVRQWRNSSVVSPYMEIRTYITPQQQQAWFAGINNIYNNYFLILFKNEPVGVVYGAAIEWNKGITGNSGIFMADEKYFHTDIPLRASFLLTESGMFLGLNINYIKVLKSNKRAAFFNRRLGYKLLPGQENKENQRYCMHIKDYLACTKPIKKAMGFYEQEKITVFLKDPYTAVNQNILYRYNLFNDPDTSPFTFYFDNNEA